MKHQSSNNMYPDNFYYQLMASQNETLIDNLHNNPYTFDEIIKVSLQFNTIKQIIDFKDSNGNTLLHLAVIYKNMDLIIELIDLIDINIKNKTGYNPLQIAVNKNYLDIITTLINCNDLNLDLSNYAPNHWVHKLIEERNIERIQATKWSDDYFVVIETRDEDKNLADKELTGENPVNK